MKDIQLQHLLETRSRNSRPQRAIVVGGDLHESALGSIHFATYKTPGAEDGPIIIKTLDLNEQNIFCATLNNKRQTLRGLSDTHVVFMSHSKSEVREWTSIYRAEALISKVAYMKGPEKDGIQIMRCNEFLTEALVGLIVTNSIGHKVPHIVQTKDLWISDATGYILQEYAGRSMFKNMADLSFDEFKSIIVQCLVTLSICQKEVSLKHHDLHLDNVFIKTLKAKDPDGAKLLASDTWLYKLSDGLTISIMHHGLLAKIGDFGLASATDPVSKIRIQRADMDLLDAGEAEWGQWTPDLEDHTAYDALVLLSKFFLEEERSMCSSRQSAWARGAYDAIRAVRPSIECSLIGRPLRHKDGGSLSIEDILALDYFKEFQANSATSGLLLYSSA